MKRIIASMFICCLCLELNATTIVIYITPQFVIMAADSKGVYTDASTYKVTTSIVSKIYKTGNIYFSLAGLTSNSTQGFDVATTVNRNLNDANINTSIQQVKTSVEKTLLIYLTNQKKNNPVLYRNNLASERYITSIGIVTIKKNKPYSHIIGFRVIDGDPLKITSDEETYLDGKRDAVYYLGTSGAINRYMNTISKNNLKPEQFVEKLMNLQINKTPNLVAAPIDIIKITPDKTDWIKRKKGTPIELRK